MRNILLSLVFTLLFFPLFSQKYSLEIKAAYPVKGAPVFQKKEYKDSLSLFKDLNRLPILFHEEGFLLATIDSIKQIGKRVTAFVSPNERFEWTILKRGNVPDNMMEKAGYRERLYREDPFKIKELVSLEENILEYAENHGYPFSTIGLDSVEINGTKLKASMRFIPGPQIKFDSLVLKGNSKVKKKYMTRYLRIFPGQEYSEEKVKNIPKLIKTLPYLTMTQTPDIEFSGNKARIVLYLQEINANQVDGVIGVLPNSNNNNKLLVTGDANLNLKNLFGTGKNLKVIWQRFKEQSQNLDITFMQPKLLASNLDLQFDFSLLKQDTTFLNVSRGLTFYQPLSSSGKLNFSAALKTSRRTGAPVISDSSQVPAYADYDLYAYGIGYDWNNLDNIFLPRKGWLISLKGVVGNKNIRKNSNYDEKLYHGVQLKSLQLGFTFRVEKYSRIGKQGGLYTRLNSGWLYNDNKLFLNDLFRVGGFKTLRGFNENNFYVSEFVISTLEYRFYTDPGSYLMVFYDQAYIYSPYNVSDKDQFPLGFGAGLSFTTNAGVFNFAYSLGSSPSQKLSFQLSKIHFGLVSRF